MPPHTSPFGSAFPTLPTHPVSPDTHRFPMIEPTHLSSHTKAAGNARPTMKWPANVPSARPSSSLLVPIVVEQTGRGERSFDIYSRLLQDRIVFIGTPIDDYVANLVIAQMLFLQMQDPKKDVNLYINSPGGSVTAGLAIYDTMQFLTCDVNTYCIGIAASMGAVLLAAGSKGKRYALPNSDIMIHQVSGGAQGSASDVERTVEYMFKLKKRLIHILAQHTGQPEDTVHKDSDRDYYMTSEEAREYGLVDHVVQSRKDVKSPDTVGGGSLAPKDSSTAPLPDNDTPGPEPAKG